MTSPTNNPKQPEQKDEQTSEANDFLGDAEHFSYANAASIFVGLHDFRLRFYDVSKAPSQIINNPNLLNEQQAEVEIAMPIYFMLELADLLLQQINNIEEVGLLDFHQNNIDAMKKIAQKKLSFEKILQKETQGRGDE